MFLVFIFFAGKSDLLNVKIYRMGHIIENMKNEISTIILYTIFQYRLEIKSLVFVKAFNCTSRMLVVPHVAVTEMFLSVFNLSCLSISVFNIDVCVRDAPC